MQSFPVLTTKFVLLVLAIIHLGHEHEQSDRSNRSGSYEDSRAALYCCNINWILEFANLLFLTELRMECLSGRVCIKNLEQVLLCS